MNLIDHYNRLINLNINVNDEQVLTILKLLLKNEPFAFARFNDGEMMGIDKVGSKVARGDQVVNKSLHDELIKSIKHVQKNYFVGIPCKNCFPKYYNLANNLVKQNKNYILNATALTNRNWIEFIKQFPLVTKDNKILWISGADQNLDFLKNKLNLNIVHHMKYPSKDSWTHYDVIENMYHELDIEHDVVMVSLGPTARIFAQKMFSIYPDKTYIDIGSTFDPFTRDVWHNCHLGWIVHKKNKTRPCSVCN